MIVEVAPHEGRMSRRCARAGVSSGWWSMTRSTSPNASSKKLGWASTIATMSYSSIACPLISSTSMSRMRVIARFSGRVIVPNVAMGAAALVRPRSVRSASAEAIASGSGSSCIMMSTRSADAKWLRTRSVRLRAEAREDVRSRMLSEVCSARAAGQADLSEEPRPEIPEGAARLDPPAEGPVDRARPGERRRSQDPRELPGRHQPVLEHDVADRDAPRLCLLDDLRGDVVAEIGRERRGLDTAPREELAHPGAVHPEPGDASRPQQPCRPGQQLEALGEVRGAERCHHVELELARRGRQRDRVVVGRYLEARHLDRLGHGGVDLAGHDRRPRLDLRETQLAEARRGSGGEKPQVEADLAEVYGEGAQRARARQDRPQAPRRRDRARRRAQAPARDPGELADDQDAEARVRRQPGAQRPRRPPSRSLARFAMTSFTFMWVGVPAPAWNGSSTATSGTVPSATRAAAQTMARAHPRGRRPSLAFARAAAALTCA